MANFSLALLFLLLINQAYGQPAIYWQDIANNNAFDETSISSRASNKRLVKADFISLNEDLLSKKPFYDVTLPLPNGKTVLFRLEKSSVIASELQERYPNIQTYKGFQLNKPDNQGRFDISPYGFHGMFRFENDTVFIEPANIGNKHHYVSYFKSDAELPAKHIIKQLPPKRHVSQHFTTSSSKKKKSVSNTKFRTYRIAISATGEYTQYHQGTKASGLAAIITLVNRLNDIFQRDLGIKLELVANNDLIIYTDANSDPFNNNNSDGDL
ncbi:MAG: hypothetical protein GY787_23245, partial [Alteromonadales bacterium]|nr:hypothetical protein [Alteromonadales bacterium]